VDVNVHVRGDAYGSCREALMGVLASTLLNAVTGLTSLEQKNLLKWGDIQTDVQGSAGQKTQECGLRCVVCSPVEGKKPGSALGSELLLLTAWISQRCRATDQKRIVAFRSRRWTMAAVNLVIGRPY